MRNAELRNYATNSPVNPQIGRRISLRTVEDYATSTPERMNIRINKATNPGAWYANRVGKVLPVESVEINRRPEQGIPEDVYWVRTGDSYNTINYVRKSDAIEV